MATNNSFEINKKLMDAFVPAFDSQRVVTKVIDTNMRNLVDGFDETTGDEFGAVRMKRPIQARSIRTPDGDLTGKDKNPINVGSVPAFVGDYVSHIFELSDVERALEAKDNGAELQQLIAPAAESTAITLENEVLKHMNDAAALQTGTHDKPITQWDDIAMAGGMLKSIGLPTGGRTCVISDFDAIALAADQKGLAVNPEVANALRDATIASNYAGFERVLTTDNLHAFKAGTATTGLTIKTAPVQTYNACKSTYRQTLVLTGGTNGETLTAGTTLIIDAVNMVHLRTGKTIQGKGNLTIPLTVTVLEDATFDASTDATVTVSGCAIFEGTGALDDVNSAYNTVDAKIVPGNTVAVDATSGADISYRLAFHNAAFGMGSIKLKRLHATDSSFVTNDGINIRVSMFADGIKNNHQIRLDMRPTYAVYNPFAIEKVSGNV